MAKRGTSIRQLSDEMLVGRLFGMLTNTAEGRRSISDDRQYPQLRAELRRRGLVVPELVTTHPSLDSFTADIRRLGTKDERAAKVRDQFEPTLQSIGQTPVDPLDAALWTGTEGRAARLQLVRGLLPLAQNAVDSMITELSEENANGAPLLDSRVEAIEHLRKLHTALGELLVAVENGHFDDELGQNLQAEVARYGKRAARALRDDPMPYLSSALLLGLFAACGIPDVGAYLGGIALTVKKHATGG